MKLLTHLLVDVLRAFDIFGLGLTSLVDSLREGDEGGVPWTAETGNADVTPLRPELLGLLGVGVVDIIRLSITGLCQYLKYNIIM